MVNYKCNCWLLFFSFSDWFKAYRLLEHMLRCDHIWKRTACLQFAFSIHSRKHKLCRERWRLQAVDLLVNCRPTKYRDCSTMPQQSQRLKPRSLAWKYLMVSFALKLKSNIIEGWMSTMFMPLHTHSASFYSNESYLLLSYFRLACQPWRR